MADESAAYQLARLADARRLISRQVNRRRGAARLQVTADWRRLIDEALRDGDSGTSPADDGEEELARQEKAAALEMLATSRFSVLVGAAGTGKTTLLRALASIPEVAGGGLLLLAPTGKARVRMQDVIGPTTGATAQTLAQLLIKDRRYDPDTGRYQRSDRRPGQLGPDRDRRRVLDAHRGGARRPAGRDRGLRPAHPGRRPAAAPAYRRGQAIRRHRPAPPDPVRAARLPPGRAASYAELTIPRRHSDTAPGGERADLLLAEWFAGGEPEPGRRRDMGPARPGTRTCRRYPSGSGPPRPNWTSCCAAPSPTPSRRCRRPTIPSVSSCPTAEPRPATHMYFNVGAAARAENWQVLSPVRASAGGVNEINRMLQRSYRASMLSLARNRGPSRAEGPQASRTGGDRLRRQGHQYPQQDPQALLPEP